MTEIPPTPETYAYSRIWQTTQPGDNNDIFPVHLLLAAKAVINWDSVNAENHSELDFEGKHYFLHYSRPAWYVQMSDNFKIVDLLVISPDANIASVEFAQLKATAEAKRVGSQKMVEELLPELQSLPGVAVIMGRGTVYDPARLPASEGDDIDVMLFLDRDFERADQIQDVIDRLTKMSDGRDDLNCSIGITTFKSTSTDEDIGEHKPQAKFKLAVDLFPWPYLKNNFPMVLQVVRPYYVDTLLRGKILVDNTEGEFEQVRQAVIAARTKA